MKLKWTPALTARTVSGVIIAACAVLLYLGLQNAAVFRKAIGGFFSLFTPFMMGLALAFLLNRPLVFVETKVLPKIFKKKKKPLSPRVLRVISMAVVLVLYLLILGLFCAMIIPHLVDSVITLANSFSGYVNSLLTLVDQLMSRMGMDGDALEATIGSWSDHLSDMLSHAANLAPKIFDISKQALTTVLNLFVGFIIAIYMMADKERFCGQAKKVTYSLLPNNTAHQVVRAFRLVNERFSGFVIGKIIDSAIIAVLCFIGMSVLKLPYTLLISTIVGVTNVIPFFGPFIGAIPSAFIILVIDPMQCVWFLIFILVLQQIDGNIIGPSILGDTTQLPAFWVMFAILVGGNLLGVVGMFIAVPLFSVIYVLLKEFFEARLRARGLPTQTEDYESSSSPIDEDQLTLEK